MRKLLLGAVQYAAGRAFIPVIEEIAKTTEAGGIYVARPLSLVIVDTEGVTLTSFEGSWILEELVSQVPELERLVEEARRSL